MSLDRVCMITTFYPPWSFGGDAVAVQGLAHALADEGVEVTVVHCADSYRVLAGRPPAHDTESHPGVRVVPLSGRVPLASPAVTYLTGRPGLKERRLRDEIDRGRFDVTHFHNVSLFGPGVLGMGSGVRMLTLHDHWLVCPMHVLWQDNRRVCETPHCARCSARFRRPPQIWRRTGLLRSSLENIDVVIAPSSFVVEEHARRGLPLNAVVLPAFAPKPPTAPEPLAPDLAQFAFVGRLEPMKGVLELIDAVAEAPDVSLVVAGDGALAAEAQRRADLSPNVRLAGRLGRPQLDALYTSSCAILVPSLGLEAGGPMVAVEAFAHGTPVVGRRRGAITEYLEAAGGVLFDHDDEIVPTLRRLRDNPALRAQLSQRARAAYETRHTPRTYLDAYTTTVSSAQKQRSAPRRQA